MHFTSSIFGCTHIHTHRERGGEGGRERGREREGGERERERAAKILFKNFQFYILMHQFSFGNNVLTNIANVIM